MAETEKPSPSTLNISMDGLPSSMMQIAPDLLKGLQSAGMQRIQTSAPAPAPAQAQAPAPAATPTSSENNNG